MLRKVILRPMSVWIVVRLLGIGPLFHQPYHVLYIPKDAYIGL